MHRTLSQWISSLLVGSFVLTVALGPDAAIAQSRRYSGSGSAPRTSGIGGSRSGDCAGAGQTSFTALAPIGHVGQTASTRPTITLYVPDSQPLSIDFRIYPFNASGQLQPQPVYRAELSSQPGIMAITLPTDQPELVVGQRYYWRAALVCDPNHRSEDLLASAELEVVAASTPESERWYDLMTAALNKNPADRTDLLQELVALEQQAAEALPDNQSELSEELQRHEKHLNEIIATEP